MNFEQKIGLATNYNVSFSPSPRTKKRQKNQEQGMHILVWLFIQEF